MSTEKRTEGEPIEPTPAQGAANDTAPGAAQPDAEAAAAAASVPENGEIARVRAEAAELKDRLLRTHAEMDNVRKRLEKEKSEMAKFAIAKFARDVVGIGDNVQRAIDAVPNEAAEQDPALKSFLEGVTMIEREFVSVLERHGIKRLDPKGQMFNPHLHQAVMEMPVADVPSGTVTQVFQLGYTIEERVLRPAMVVVAKGGMRPQVSTGEAPAQPSADGGADPAPSATEGDAGREPGGQAS